MELTAVLKSVTLPWRLNSQQSWNPTLYHEGETHNSPEFLHFTMKMKLTTVLKSCTYPENETHNSPEISHFTLKMKLTTVLK
jgi:hypothetical protein